ncbi:Lrp/AsnC family transcriptional regulator, partial [Hyella patelloides]|uniref:Lrp/AsnC family transcriptional regulator n=1 Tax=Hyella patelloides TaxID=1982969 RepID=UPI0011A87665
MTFDYENKLDETSWQLLQALQEDARLSYAELGRRVSLSPPAVAERVRKMEEIGIITGYRVEINAEKIGLP